MKEILALNAWVLSTLFLVLVLFPITGPGPRCETPEVIKLPEPKHDGSVSIEKALGERRSIRDFWNQPLALADISQLLWAAQGVTAPEGYRTAPSAGALYPLEVYLVAGKVDGLPPGIYKYRPQGHEMVRTEEGDRRSELCGAALSQNAVKYAPAVIVIAAVYERTSRKYLGRAKQYVHMEVGHAAQNVCLQGVSLDIGTVVIGAFHDDDVKKVMSLPEREEPLYIIPCGRRIRRS